MRMPKDDHDEAPIAKGTIVGFKPAPEKSDDQQRRVTVHVGIQTYSAT